MKLRVMSIFDSASLAYLPPFVVATEAMAMRQIRDVALKQPDHDFVRHGDQFVLFSLGSWDNETCEFVAEELRSLGSMLTIIGRKESHGG